MLARKCDWHIVRSCILGDFVLVFLAISSYLFSFAGISSYRQELDIYNGEGQCLVLGILGDFPYLQELANGATTIEERGLDPKNGSLPGEGCRCSRARVQALSCAS